MSTARTRPNALVSRDFRLVTKRGRKAKGRYCIVYRLGPVSAGHGGAGGAGAGGDGSVGAGGGVSRDVSGELVSWGGPRYGLIVTKAIGNAVVRHRVSRVLRAVARDVIVAGSAADETGSGGSAGSVKAAEMAGVAGSADVAGEQVAVNRSSRWVIRALPAAATAGYKEVRADVETVVDKLEQLG